jgi:hypothetical protein
MQHLYQRMLYANDWLFFVHVDRREAGLLLAQCGRLYLSSLGSSYATGEPRHGSMGLMA